MKGHPFYLRLRFRLISLLTGITGNKRLIREKLITGALIVGLMAAPACRTKKKATCYLLMIEKNKTEVASQAELKESH